MFGQATFLLFMLVAGALCLPHKIGVGFDTGASGSTGLTGGAGVKLDRKDGLLYDYSGHGVLGAHAKGKVHGGGYAELNDNKVGGEAEAHGNIGGKLKDNFAGEIGVDSHGNAALGLVNTVGASGKVGGGASGNAGTNEDAESYKKNFKGGSMWDQMNEDY